jgi:hypothetical protein
MKQQTISVYFNPGVNAAKPWHVGLHDGTAIAEQFGTYSNPVEAIKRAMPVSAERKLPIVKPAWLKVVLA